MARSAEPDLVNVPPIFCHTSQMETVVAFQRRHCIMASLHTVNLLNQLEGRETPPTFIYYTTRDDVLNGKIDKFVARTIELDGIAVNLLGLTK